MQQYDQGAFYFLFFFVARSKIFLIFLALQILQNPLNVATCPCFTNACLVKPSRNELYKRQQAMVNTLSSSSV